MWNLEKFGAVSSLERAATPRPPIFLNPTPRFGFDEPFALSDFGAGSPPFCIRPSRNCGKLNRQTPIIRKHSKSQKTNNRDLLKSPKYQILQNHKLRACGRRTSHLGVIGGLFLSGFCEQFRPFLTGSAPQTEFDVTLSKQTTEKFLTGARTPFRRHQISQDFRRNCTRGTRVAVHGSRRPPATSHSPLTTAFRYNAPAQTSPARLAT
jgi:hypothetical protein